MPIAYAVHEEGSLVHAKATGKVTEEDVVCYKRAIATDPRIKPGFRELFDAISAVDIGVTEDTVAKVSEIDNAHPDTFRGTRAAIVVQGARGFDLAKLYDKIYDGPGTVIVFYNLDIAKTWLGCKGA